MPLPLGPRKTTSSPRATTNETRSITVRRRCPSRTRFVTSRASTATAEAREERSRRATRGTYAGGKVRARRSNPDTHDTVVCQYERGPTALATDTCEFVRHPWGCPQQFRLASTVLSTGRASMISLHTSTWIWASVGTVSLMGATVACSLNPQSLPPDTAHDGGASVAAADASSLGLGDGSVPPRLDAGTSMPTGGEDASAGASRDAGTAEGGSSSDGGPNDAAIDAEDGGVPADSATDAAADETTADAPADAAIDAPAEAD